MIGEVCFLLVCEPVRHWVEAHSFNGFRGMTSSSSPIVQGDGLLAQPLLPVESVCEETHSRQWISGFVADLVSSEVRFTTFVVYFVGNLIQTLAFVNVWAWGWLGILLSIAQQL